MLLQSYNELHIHDLFRLSFCNDPDCRSYRKLYLLLRSKFLAPAVLCVVILVSIFTVWRLLVSLDIITLCHWLSFRGLLELPLMRFAPFPKSNT